MAALAEMLFKRIKSHPGDVSTIGEISLRVASLFERDAPSSVHDIFMDLTLVCDHVTWGRSGDNNLPSATKAFLATLQLVQSSKINNSAKE